MNEERNIAIEFDEFSKNYTNDMIGLAPNYLQLVSSFVQHLPENFNPSSILDLGCGNGNITAQLIPRFPGATYTLVDASAEMIELCRKLFRDYEVHYANNYFRDFSFRENHYDLIVAGFSLHHCDDEEKQEIFRNIYSALKKGGIFCYSDLMISKTNPDHPMVLKQWGEFVNSNYPGGEKWTWVMEHYDEYDKPTDYNLQIEWLKDAGFRNIKMPFKKDYWAYLQAIKS